MATAPKLVRIEGLVNPDVHVGDGRVLKGPERNGTRLVKRGDVTEVSQEIADILIGNGQAALSTANVTVFLPD
jgi:hypothetical protein